MNLSSKEKPWGKGFTPKRYIHPPLAEQIVTMWPTTMVMLGEIMGGRESQRSVPGRANESVSPSCGMAFLYKNRLLDYKNVTYHTRGDGIPIHAITQNLGEVSLHQESFCNIERVPTAFVKLTIRNNTDAPLCDTVSMIARTAPEFDLIGCREPDGYFEPEPSVYRWMIHPLWVHTKGKITDGTYSVYYQHDDKVICDYEDYYFVHLNFSLAPQEEATVYCAFGRGALGTDFSYEAEKSKAEAFWNGELAKIDAFPNKNDRKFFAMYRSLVAQCLQMFCYPQNEDYVLVRQGGLQRFIWPTEAYSLLQALSEIGGFDDYVDKALDMYFNVLQIKEGENKGQIVNFGIPWGSVTGAVLISFGSSAMKCRANYEKYKEDARKAFLWMEGQREITKKDRTLAYGLFPPYKSCDYGESAQIWGLTDAWNLRGYKAYAEALEVQGDEHAKDVQKAYEDYRACMEVIFNRAVEEQKDSAVLLLPQDARNNPEIEEKMKKQLLDPGFTIYYFLAEGFAGYNTETAKKLLNLYKDGIKRKNGLTHPITKSNISDEGYQWYVSMTEYEAYYYFKKAGDTESIREIIDAHLKYMMTEEYYMTERYDDHNPYFMPWTPNASANGRTIILLCDYYKK